MNSVKIKNGQTNKVDVITEKDIETVLPNNYNPSDIKYKYHLKDLTAPVKKDQKSNIPDPVFFDAPLSHHPFFHQKSIRIEKKAEQGLSSLLRPILKDQTSIFF